MISWESDLFLPALGLENNLSHSGKPYPIKVAVSKIDPATGGAVGLWLEGEGDGKGGVSELHFNYWYKLPNNQHFTLRLARIRTRPEGNRTVLDDLWVIKKTLY